MTWEDEIRKVRVRRQGDSPSPENKVKVFGENRPLITLEGEYKTDADKLYDEFERAVHAIYVKYDTPTWFSQKTLKIGLEDIAEAVLIGIKQREADFDKSKTGE